MGFIVKYCGAKRDFCHTALFAVMLIDSEVSIKLKCGYFATLKTTKADFCFKLRFARCLVAH